MTILHFDCSSGSAGDMLLGALLDAGATEQVVRSQIEGLGLSGWVLDLSEVSRSGLRATRAEVKVSSEPHRSYRDVQDVLNAAGLSDEVRTAALATFERLATAEAAVHGTTLEDVHLHEVGATDALIDVVGVCAAILELSPELITCSSIATGSGTVATEHGDMPLPVPAVLELLPGAELFSRGTAELITPTGAALLANFVDDFTGMPPMRLMRVGSGAGGRDLTWPNLIRVFIGEPSALPRTEQLAMIEANLDDFSPELFPYVIDLLIGAGARDAWVTPISMKKGRSATTLSVLCEVSDVQPLADLVFRETTTLGVRIDHIDRLSLERSWVEVVIEGEVVRVKVGYLGDEPVNLAPEFEDARRVATVSGRPLKDVYSDAISKARSLI